MFARGSSKESTRKVTPPSPSYMSNEQFGMLALAFPEPERSGQRPGRFAD